MNKFRSVAALSGLALTGLLASPRPAEARGALRVAVHAPHASFAIRTGHRAFPVGHVLAPYDAHRVFYRRPYGYGFWAPVGYCSFHHIRHAHFVPVRPYGRTWIVVGAGHRGYVRYGRGYRRGH
jgi:hypothetical protein